MSDFKFIGGIKYLRTLKEIFESFSEFDNTIYNTHNNVNNKSISKKGDMKNYTYPQGIIKAINQKLANKQAKKKGWIDNY